MVFQAQAKLNGPLSIYCLEENKSKAPAWAASCLLFSAKKSTGKPNKCNASVTLDAK